MGNGHKNAGGKRIYIRHYNDMGFNTVVVQRLMA